MSLLKVDQLPLTLISEHFVIHYGLRNPRHGRGLGPSGVSDTILVRSYLSSLERLYRTMTGPPWNRPVPVTDGSRKTHVYVCDLSPVGDGSPFMAYDRNRIPYVALSCRSSEPLNEAVMRRAAAEAVHEATHVLNFSKRPLYGPYSEPWAWLDEGLAVFMESRVLPGNQDYFRFLADWIDVPGVSLNDWQAAYQACLFLHYLSGRLGSDFPNRLWMDSEDSEMPLEALRRFMPLGLSFASADPENRDLFGAGYVMDSYFLRDDRGGCFAPDLCTRFGDRAVVQSAVLSRGEECTVKGELPHLACHYFRVFPHRTVERLRFTFRTLANKSLAPFKAEVAIAGPDLSRGRVEVLRPPRTNTADGVSLATEIGDLDQIDLHHLVLVVSNCDCREISRYNQTSTREPYEIQISAA
ncbi:MAG TPA: DUF6055 domain-containing protein [Thermoanaerobaculia bacterium]|nr:DUF6055 domain-containing protein [Thermoanaerobaculia bacterium]